MADELIPKPKKKRKESEGMTGNTHDLAGLSEQFGQQLGMDGTKAKEVLRSMLLQQSMGTFEDVINKVVDENWPPERARKEIEFRRAGFPDFHFPVERLDDPEFTLEKALSEKDVIEDDFQNLLAGL